MLRPSVAVGLRFLIWYNLPWIKPLIAGAFFVTRAMKKSDILLKQSQLSGVFAMFTAGCLSITDDRLILLICNLEYIY